MAYGPIAPALTCKAIFGRPNHAFNPLAQITVTSAAAGAPASYLLSNDTAEVWRSTSTAETDIWFSFSDDSSFTVAVLGLLFNESAKATRMQGRLYSEPLAEAMADTKPIYDSGILRAWTPWQVADEGGTVLPWGEFIWGGAPPAEILAARPRHWIHPLMLDGGMALRSLSCKSVRITITGSALVDYWQAGMLWVSGGDLPSHNLNLADFNRGWEDLSVPVRGNNGRREVLDRGRLRRLGLVFGRQSRAVTDNKIESWAATIGSGGPMLVIPEPGKPSTWWTDASVYSLESLAGSRREMTMSDMWEAGLSLLEWR